VVNDPQPILARPRRIKNFIFTRRKRLGQYVHYSVMVVAIVEKGRGKVTILIIFDLLVQHKQFDKKSTWRV